MTVSEKIVVLDIGKSNIKLSVCSYLGELVETLTTPNDTYDGMPWRYHDLKKINNWVLENLSILSRRYNLIRFIAVGHGSGTVFVGDDHDMNDDGTTLPMIDYEQVVPEDVNDAYRKVAGDYLDRGCAIMKRASHTAKQMFWAEAEHPEIFRNSKWVLGISQYWAWRLSGVAVTEVTALGAQSHLWNVINESWSKIVKNQNWERLFPPIAKAYSPLGKVRERLVKDFDLPKNLVIHAGGHDSSINFYRYQSAGLKNFCVVSTGTWIVALADNFNPSKLDESLSMTINADVSGRLVGGALAAGGREYESVSGSQPKDVKVDIASLSKIIEQQTMAIPSFSNYDGPFPDSAQKGRIEGPIPANQKERHALAVLYTALLTVTCANTLGLDRDLILDGSYLRDPVFAQIVAMLCSNRKTYCDTEIYGIASGGALLCSHREVSAQLNLYVPSPIKQIPDIHVYAKKWKALTTNQMKG